MLSLVLFFILIITLAIVYLNPKKDLTDQPSDDVSEQLATQSVQTQSSAANSEVLAAIHKQNEKKITAGEVCATNSDFLVQWYCHNMLDEYGTLSDTVLIFKNSLYSSDKFTVHRRCIGCILKI
jgi:hypothetical protein